MKSGCDPYLQSSTTPEAVARVCVLSSASTEASCPLLFTDKPMNRFLLFVLCQSLSSTKRNGCQSQRCNRDVRCSTLDIVSIANRSLQRCEHTLGLTERRLSISTFIGLYQRSRKINPRFYKRGYQYTHPAGGDKTESLGYIDPGPVVQHVADCKGTVKSAEI